MFDWVLSSSLDALSKLRRTCSLLNNQSLFRFSFEQKQKQNTSKLFFIEKKNPRNVKWETSKEDKSEVV